MVKLKATEELGMKTESLLVKDSTKMVLLLVRKKDGMTMES